MHGNSSVCVLTDVQESSDDGVTGRAAVYEEQLKVVKTGIHESLGVVDLPVQTHHCRYVVFPEVREVGLRCVQRVTCRGQSFSQCV